MTAEAVCPATETLCGWVEGRLEEDDRALLEHHLDSCPACRRAVAEVGRVLGAADADTPEAHLTPSRAPSAPPGTVPPSGAPRLGRYEIRREIGMGGMGVVYEGFDPALGRRIALKLLRPDKSAADRAGLTERLAAEARALAKISHPNVLTVFDVGVDGDTVFLAAEYIEGVTMDAGWPHRARGWRDRLEAYLQAARGLSAIHQAGITHRDIKPSNILLGDDGRVRITDFGLAVARGEKSAPAGTPAYMAPEQLAGQAGNSADQFALAMCMVEAINGARAPLGATAVDLEKRAKSVWGTAPPPEAVWEALARALRPRPEDRFESVDAFVHALESALTGPASRAAPRSRSAPVAPARGAYAGYAAIGIAIAAGGVATAAALRSPPAAPGGDTNNTVMITPAAPASGEAAPPPVTATAAPSAPAAEAPAAPPPAVPGPTSQARPPDAVAAPAPAPVPTFDPSDPMSGLKRTLAIQDKIREATSALTARDGKTCLAKLDEAIAIEPSNASSLELYRGQCEMLVGRCEQGARRIRGSKALGGNTEQIVQMYQGMYCPASASQSPKDQLKAIWMQAGTASSAEKCAQFEAQLQKTLASFGKEKPDATAVTGAWSAVGTCWVMAGDCTRGRAAAARFIAADRLDAYMENWIGGMASSRCKK